MIHYLSNELCAVQGVLKGEPTISMHTSSLNSCDLSGTAVLQRGCTYFALVDVCGLQVGDASDVDSILHGSELASGVPL